MSKKAFYAKLKHILYNMMKTCTEDGADVTVLLLVFWMRSDSKNTHCMIHCGPQKGELSIMSEIFAPFKVEIQLSDAGY